MPDHLQSARDSIIVAVDTDDPGKALDIVQPLVDHVGAFKLGLEFWTSMCANFVLGSAIDVAAFHPAYQMLFTILNGKTMQDWKLNDIPNTMGKATKQVTRLKPRFLTVHAGSGMAGMQAAVKQAAGSHVLAVTVLTSFAEDEAFLTFGAPSKAKVIQFARNALLAGCDGIVCSPQELQILAKFPELSKLMKVTPGVRPAGTDKGDQGRVMTPYDAIKSHADFLVIGRPITDAPDPVATAKAIAEEMAVAFEESEKR
ncbi:MAG: orotidine-5'-phosphate decarboxylase [Patescibacteria group bacterium]|nr:orotidine-5'-phosphate decarboxylase [Patescibacteria group bacterium]